MANPYIQSLRLRTLPLSVSGIVLGTGLALDKWHLANERMNVERMNVERMNVDQMVHDQMVNSTLSLDPSYLVHCPFVHLLVFILAILTTLSLQILSNLCNELGDTLKGTDADQHGRKAYGLQSGALTIRQMKTMIWTFVALSVLFGTALILVAFLPSILNSQLSTLNSQFSILN